MLNRTQDQVKLSAMILWNCMLIWWWLYTDIDYDAIDSEKVLGELNLILKLKMNLAIKPSRILGADE